MLVVTANWAFSDGTLAPTRATARVARAWLRSLRHIAIRAGFGGDGRYRPLAGLDVVLAGDTFDGLLSAAWGGRDRPWRATLRAADTRRRVMIGCSRRAAPLLAGLARLVRSGLEFPSADSRGRPDPRNPTRVPVRVTVLPGDRDRWVGDLAAVVAARGGTVAPAWSDDTVLVAHGHEFDPTRHAADPTGRDERPPSLAESLVVDLVVPFFALLDRGGAGTQATRHLVAALAAADASEFPAVVAAWCGRQGPGAVLDDATRRDVAAAWGRAVDAWLRSARRDRPDCGLPASPLEALADWLVADSRGRHPALLDALRVDVPAAASHAAGRRRLVLGHPSTSGSPGVICLGRPAVRRWTAVAVVRGTTASDVACVAPPPPWGPATIVRHGAGPWRWLGGVDEPVGGGATPAITVVDAA